MFFMCNRGGLKMDVKYFNIAKERISNVKRKLNE